MTEIYINSFVVLISVLPTLMRTLHRTPKGKCCEHIIILQRLHQVFQTHAALAVEYMAGYFFATQVTTVVPVMSNLHAFKYLTKVMSSPYQ